MPYEYFNPNPKKQRVDDCTIRALCKVTSKDWSDAYSMLCAEGLYLCDIPTSNYVLGMVLRSYGFDQCAMPSIYPSCTKVSEFAYRHDSGSYVLVTEEHVVSLIDGIYYDTADSGDETILYYFKRRENI